MKSNRLAAVAAALALAGLVAGCGDNGTEPSPEGMSDQNQIANLIIAAPSLIDDGLVQTEAQTALAPGSPGRTASAPIEPQTFWRDIRSAYRAFEFAFADTDTTGLPTSAIATVHWHLAGVFNIVTQSTPRPVQKPLVDHWQRRVLLRRIPMEGGDPTRPIWRIAAVSGVDVASTQATTHIVSLHVQCASLDTVITDPLAFFYLRRVLRFAADEPVTLTLTTERSDDVALLYHHLSRQRMTNNGDNTYTGILPAGTVEGWRHFGVNALSHGTLYDDEAPYDSHAWIFPYVVAPTPSVDYLP
jgi:hypothetical protein